MASTSSGPNYASTVANDSTVGTTDWTNPTNAQGAADDVFATITKNASAVWQESSIKIVKGGTISGDDKSTGATLPTTGSGGFPANGTWVTYGGALDTWNVQFASSDINASTFGVVFSAVSTGVGPITSHYLKATNFGFSIPSDSLIEGIKVEINEDYEVITSSFVAGTEVSTPYGKVPIEEIKVGDLVWAITQNKRMVQRRVKRLTHAVKPTWIIATRDRTVECTPDHRFLTDRGWVEASKLIPGHRIYMENERFALVSASVSGIGKKDVYCFSVSGSPSFCANGFWVHNLIVGVNTTGYIDSFRITVYYSTQTSFFYSWGGFN